MAEFEEKLNTLLGDPEAMGQILSIAKALTGEGEKAPESQGPPPPPPLRTKSRAPGPPPRLRPIGAAYWACWAD